MGLFKDLFSKKEDVYDYERARMDFTFWSEDLVKSYNEKDWYSANVALNYLLEIYEKCDEWKLFKNEINDYVKAFEAEGIRDENGEWIGEFDKEYFADDDNEITITLK